MWDDVTSEYLHHASMAGMDDITFDDLNLDVFTNIVLGLMI